MHDHTGPDGFTRRCYLCGGEGSPISWKDVRMSCDNCGEIYPCCNQGPRDMIGQHIIESRHSQEES